MASTVQAVALARYTRSHIAKHLAPAIRRRCRSREATHAVPHRSAVALRHVAFEDVGLMSAVLGAAGWTISYRDAATAYLDDPAISAADLLIVLGGPIGVYDNASYPFLMQDVAILRSRLAQNLPTLGICLGCQLMAHALGARVFPGSAKEIGWGTRQLTEAGLRSCLGGLAPDAAVLHWHGDTFDLPDGTTRLASTAGCQNQAFTRRHNVLALQFHLDADPGRLEEWYVGHAVELSAAGIAVADLRAATYRVASGLRQ
jgi:GMP synthase (glutamine-hydrolysing)